jgi:hypothetical protein
MKLRYLKLMLVASALFLMADTCPHTIYQADTTITVFEDQDADGRFDKDEPLIPETLVVAVYNVHGTHNHLGLFTDEMGQVRVRAEYTHFYNLIVVSPCGTTPTGDTMFRRSDKKQLEVGFEPTAPRPGTATLHLWIWDDQDGNGQQDAGESPLGSSLIYVGFQQDGSSYETALQLRVDEQGFGDLALGNSCGTVWLRPPDRWMAAGGEVGEWMSFTYDLGINEIEWGLFPMPTPTPRPTLSPTESE